MDIHAVLAIVNVPFVTAYFTKSVPRQIGDQGKRGMPRLRHTEVNGEKGTLPNQIYISQFEPSQIPDCLPAG